MKPIASAYWNELKNTVEYYQKKDNSIFFDDSDGKFQGFYETFKSKYKAIQANYMKKRVTTLDRHKVAAVMIVTTIEKDVIKYRAPLQNEHVFLGAEMFSTEVALSWMLDSLNKKLNELGKTPLDAYHMPKAFSCDTPYFEIFTRNLFFTYKDYKLSPLDIAEKLFLLEYISLLKNDIDPSILHEGEK